MPHSLLLACHECDVVQREASIAPGAQARCVRCGATLYRRSPGGLDRSLALAVAALVLIVIANAFPVLALEVSGQRTEATLIDAARVLKEQHSVLLGVLVVGTGLVAPAAVATITLYTVLLLQMGRIPPGFVATMRFGGLFRPWGMVEVFMLGVLVSLVKLSHIAHVVPGVGIWAVACLMVVLTGLAASVNDHDLWARYEQLREARAPEARPGRARA